MDALRSGSSLSAERHTPGNSSNSSGAVSGSNASATATSSGVASSVGMLHDELDGLFSNNDEPAVEIEIRVNPLPQEHATLVDLDKGLRLIQFCREGDFHNAKKLILEGAPAGFITKAGWTPLSAASFSGKISLVMYLLEIGADSMYKTNKRHHQDPTALQTSSADAGNQSGTMASNSSTSASPPGAANNNASNGSSNPSSAAPPGSADSTSSAPSLMSPKLAMPEMLSSTNKKHSATGCNTPLHWAAYKGHMKVVSILLQAGFSMEDPDPVGNTALHLACAGSHGSCIEYFLANSVNTELKNQYGNTPLDLATNPSCRKLLLKFRKETHCEWCKEPFTRLRRASLCQHCHHVYCDAKPCSFTYEMPLFDTSGADDHHHTTNNNNSQASNSIAPPSANLLSTARLVRFCQDCASEMTKEEDALRQNLDQKLQQVQDLLRQIRFTTSKEAATSTTTAASSSSSGGGERPESTIANAGANSNANPAVPSNDSSASDNNSTEASTKDSSSTSDPANQDDPFPTSPEALDELQLCMNQQEIEKTMNTLTRADVETLFTSMETAQSKAADPRLLVQARAMYHQLIAQVTLQEEIVALFAQRPISVRAMLNPLKRALLQAKQEKIDGKMLLFATRVIQSAESECTLFGCHMLTKNIEQGTRKVSREIALLDQAIREGKMLGVNPKLIEDAQLCQRRLHCEIALRESMMAFEEKLVENAPATANNNNTNPAAASGVSSGTVKMFVFPDKSRASTLLQALEMRISRINTAVETASQTSGVSTALLEEAANLQKQLKKELRDETKAEDERRKVEEEAAAKAAKKSKKKKA